MTLLPRRSVAAGAAALATLLALAAVPAAAAARDPLAGLDAELRRGIAEWQVPGLAVAIVKDGQVVFARGYGVRELGGRDPVTVETRFALASTCKALTAAAIGLLVEEGKLAWDDPVRKHLPWFELHDPWVTREVTIRDLLTHRTGVGNTDYLWYGQRTTGREVMARLARAAPAYSLRDGFVYQNVMYGAAGLVIEAVSGLGYEDFVRQRLFAPLGMQGVVTFDLARAGTDDVARAHHWVDGKVTPVQAQVDAMQGLGPDPVPAAGTFRAGVADMTRWLRMLLADGRAADGTVVLKPETVAELFRPQQLVPAREFYPTQELTRPRWLSYGLGWFQQDYRGHKLDFHTGSLDGAIALVALVRELGLGLVVFGNLDHAELRHAVMLSVVDRYLGGPRRDWSRELKAHYDALRAQGEAAQAKVRAARVPDTRPTLAVPAYAGRYVDPLYGTVTVTQAGESLRVSLGEGVRGTLEHWHYDTFQVRWDASFLPPDLVTFELGQSGEIESLGYSGVRLMRERPATTP